MYVCIYMYMYIAREVEDWLKQAFVRKEKRY